MNFSLYGKGPARGALFISCNVALGIQFECCGNLCVPPANPALFSRNAVVRFGGICVSLLCVDGVNSPLLQLPIGL